MSSATLTKMVHDAVELEARVHRRVLATATDGPLDDPALADLVRREAPLLAAEQVAGVVSRVRARIGGLGPIEPLLADPQVSDVLVNGPGPVWIERSGRLERTALQLDRSAIDLLVERVVTVEDTAELRLPGDHVVRLETRPATPDGLAAVEVRELVRAALRMRPDRIVVGEVRGAEALDMLQAMNTGHDGSISTIHCNSPRDALSRLETITMMAGMDLGSRAIREQIASAIQLIVYQQRLKDGTRRLTHVTEVAGMEGEG